MLIERLKSKDFKQIRELIDEYKKSINEDKLNDVQYESLLKAIENNEIEFYVVKQKGKLIAICSISVIFSTFSCKYTGVFEDFYIDHGYRKLGIARKLTEYVFEQCKERDITSVWVGCADVDINMYKALGFEIELGNLLTWCSD